MKEDYKEEAKRLRPIKESDQYQMIELMNKKNGVTSIPFNHVEYESDLELYCDSLEAKLTTRYHPDTLEPVEKSSEKEWSGKWHQKENRYYWASEDQYDFECFNELLEAWNNALTLEQVFERYKEMREFVSKVSNQHPDGSLIYIIREAIELIIK